MELKKVIIRLLSVVAAVLIIAFLSFRLTVAYSAPTATQLDLPEDTIANTAAGRNIVTMILLGKDQIFYYDADKLSAGKKVSASEFKSVLAEKKSGTNNVGLFIKIKPSAITTYQEITGAVDEMIITHIKTYSVTKLSERETAFVKNI